MTLGMCDNEDPETASIGIKEDERPRSALGQAYERIRQFVRPKTKLRTQPETGKNAVHDPKTQAHPKTTPKDRGKGSDRPPPPRGLAFACDRQRHLREEQAKSGLSASGKKCQTTSGALPTSRRLKQQQQQQQQQRRRRKHRKRRPYTKEESEVSSSSSSDSDDDNVDNRDLWFLTRHGIEIEKKLGEGTYAQVHAGRQKKPARQVAVKIISLEKTNQRFRIKFLPRETELLCKVDHPNIIRLYSNLKYENKVFFVTELAQRGDLLGYIQRHKVLSTPVARSIFSQTLDAIDYLHRRGIYHRDLKCENILLDPGHRVKLTDFGFAREWFEPNRLCRTYCGSAAYASPEILQGLPYEPSTADIWSLGIVLFVMMQGKMPFDDADVKQMLSVVLRYDVTFSSKRPPCISLKSLIRSILNRGQWERATIGEIRRSPWLLVGSSHTSCIRATSNEPLTV